MGGLAKSLDVATAVPGRYSTLRRQSSRCMNNRINRARPLFGYLACKNPSTSPVTPGLILLFIRAGGWSSRRYGQEK
jgi:hypothetical protein